MGNRNPRLLQLIQENQEAFLRLINERDNVSVPPANQPDAPSARLAPQQQLSQSQQPGGAVSGGGAAVGNVINVTPEDKRAIDNVISFSIFNESIFKIIFFF